MGYSDYPYRLKQGLREIAFFSFTRPSVTSYLVNYPCHGQFSRYTLIPAHPFQRGYLHLIEHMIMRANVPRFAEFERHGGVYNAATTLTELSITMRSPLLSAPLPLDELLSSEWDEAGFAIERDTITQERSLIMGRNADATIGTEDDIRSFDFEQLMSYRDMIREGWTEYLYAQVQTEEPPHAYDQDWFNAGFTSIEDAVYGSAENSPQTNLMAFFLHMVARGCPHPKLWDEGDDAEKIVASLRSPRVRTYLRHNKSILSMRYDLGMERLSVFEKEFSAYSWLGLEAADIGASFNAFPWEEYL